MSLSHSVRLKQISEPRIAFGSFTYPYVPFQRTRAHKPTGTHAKSPEVNTAVDAVIQGLLGDFDRVPLASDSAVDTAPRDLGRDEQGHSGVDVEGPGSAWAQSHVQLCETTWRPGSSNAGTEVAARSSAGCVTSGCATFHESKGTQCQEPVCPDTAEQFVQMLFPNSSFSRDKSDRYRAAALLCAAQLHDDLFASKVLDPTFSTTSVQPQLGQQPRGTTLGSAYLKRSLLSLQIQTELMTLHHASADTRLWAAGSTVSCIENDEKILHPVTQHLGSCWSGKQVVDAVLFVAKCFPRRFRRCLTMEANEDPHKSPQQQPFSNQAQSLSACVRKVTDLMLNYDSTHPLSSDTLKYVSNIHAQLEQNREHLTFFEKAAKAAVEAELLFHVLQECDSEQDVHECIHSFRWYCGYQKSVLACIEAKRMEFQNLNGIVLRQLAELDPYDASFNAVSNVLHIAGMLGVLTETPYSAPLEAQPHVLRFLKSARPAVLLRLAAHEQSTRGSVFTAMPFSHLQKVAKALVRYKSKRKVLQTLVKATSMLATRLLHRIRIDFKSSSALEISDAAQAVCDVLTLEDAVGTLPELQELRSEFKRKFLRASQSQTAAISPKLMLHLLQRFSTEKNFFHRDMLTKFDQMLQQQISRSISSEAQRRAQHMLSASGGAHESMLPVEAVSQQVCNALADTPEAAQSQPCSTREEESHTQHGELFNVQFAKGSPDAALFQENRESAAFAVLVACECLSVYTIARTTLHLLVRLMVQHRLHDGVRWPKIGRLLRLANKRGLSGPWDHKASAEYINCLELLVDTHTSEGGLLHTSMIEQLSAVNTLARERVKSAPLTRAAAASVLECFAHTSHAVKRGSGQHIRPLSATLQGCSEALVPALMLLSLSRTFDRYMRFQDVSRRHSVSEQTGLQNTSDEAIIRVRMYPLRCIIRKTACCRKPKASDIQDFLVQMKLQSPAALNDYMQSVIRITSPGNVKHSPVAQRVRASMISAAANIMPLYDSLSDTDGAGGKEQLRALKSSISQLFYALYSTVKYAVLHSTTSELSSPGSDPGESAVYSDAASDAETADEAAAPVHVPGEITGQWNEKMWQDTNNGNVSVYYCLGPLWPVVQLAMADKCIKLKSGTVTTMSVMRAALPLVLRSSNLRHITPIVTCMQRYQYVNSALYSHVMRLVSLQYTRLQARHRRGTGEPATEPDDKSFNKKDSYNNSGVQSLNSSSSATKDKTQRMHTWLVCRALRSSYLPGKDIVDIMAERVQRLSDQRVRMSLVERYAAMYLDGLPASHATLDALRAAFMQRKSQWRDFAVASALQLFAERNHRCGSFEKEAVRWFEARAKFGMVLRHSTLGALSQTRQLWVLHGHHKFPQYSAAMLKAIHSRPVNTTPSPVQLEIFKVVSRIFPSAVLEQPACDGQLAVDIAIFDRQEESNARNNRRGSTKGDKDFVKVAIECDGQHHFFMNSTPLQQTHKTQLRNEMLALDGWHVVLLDTHSWHSNTWHPDISQRSEVRRRFIIDLLKKNGLERLFPLE